jgi:putative flippase GtrA
MTVGKSASGRPAEMPDWLDADKVRDLATSIPRPLRFLAVGGLGLATDTCFFTLALMNGAHPLAARILSLAVATLLTWRLNRRLTFDRTGRNQAAEVVRYLAVTASAQAVSYGVFAALVLTTLASLPQAALVVGAAAAALISYTGHRFIAFAPIKPMRNAAGPSARQEFSS